MSDGASSPRKQRRPILVHSDALRGFEALTTLGICRPLTTTTRKQELASRLLSGLTGLTGSPTTDMVFPAFNYDFGKSLVFDVDNDPIQVGALPETLRQIGLFSRSAMPFFSFLGKNLSPTDFSGLLEPFGDESTFADIIRQDGFILLFGVSAKFLTMLHYIEAMLGPPIYRYDKFFSGKVVINGVSYGCQVKMHVRPAEIGLEYDWPKIEAALIREGVAKVLLSDPPVMEVRAVDLFSFVKAKIQSDPLYLLDLRTRAILEDLGLPAAGRLTINQFESLPSIDGFLGDS